MRKVSFLLLGLLLVVALVLAACDNDSDDSDKSDATAIPDTTQQVEDDSEADSADADSEVALQITGSLANPMAWTEDEVRAMDTMEAESTNSKGETDTYTGVSLTMLLGLAEPAEDATMLAFVGETEAEVALAEIAECDNCIISFRNKGGFSVVLPDFSKDAQVKGVTELIIK